MEIQQAFYSLPKFTRSYMLSVFVTTFCITYIPKLPVFYYFFLNFELALNHLQLWRLFTNFLIVGKFSYSFLFLMLMIYGVLSRMEKAAVETNRYAEFVMILVYNALFVIVSRIN